MELDDGGPDNRVCTVCNILYDVEQHYRLVIVGHSLGAGAAAILAIILKPKYPKLQCFAYAPPGCVVKYVALCCSYQNYIFTMHV